MSQDEYIAILFNDLGFTGPQRRAWLQAEYGVRYSDQLTTHGRSQVIDRLKVMKAEAREAAAGARVSGAESGLLFDE